MAPVSTPFDDNSKLKKNPGEIVSQNKYIQIIDNLMHLMNFTRPDIAYEVCRYTHNPNNDN